MRNVLRLRKISAEFLAGVFSNPRFELTADNLSLLWLEVPEEKTSATGDFGLVFSAASDPYLRLIVWYDDSQKDLAEVEPRHCSLHWV